MYPAPGGHQLNLGRRLRVVSREENVEREQAARVGGVVRARDHHLQRAEDRTQKTSIVKDGKKNKKKKEKECVWKTG